MKKFNTNTIQNLALLAQIHIDDQHVANHLHSLSTIMAMIAKIADVDTTALASDDPLSTAQQRLRPDDITESNQRALFQSLTPHTANGFYLVPKVID